ncbi:MAG TPA: hypothetical protein VGE77_03490 [Nocardioides sp.]
MQERGPHVRLLQGPLTGDSLEDEIARALASPAPVDLDRAVAGWLRTLWAVGAWLREQHAVSYDDGEPPTWHQPPWVPAPHRSSLATWSRLLARGGTRLHGPLGLDHIHRTPSGTVDVVAPERRTGHPAADVGGVVADLLRLETEVAPPRAAHLGRLVTAFTASYCGLPPTSRVDEVALRRAIALRSVHRSGDDAPDATRTRIRALVEQSWLTVD